jgi:hypothetical protein
LEAQQKVATIAKEMEAKRRLEAAQARRGAASMTTPRGITVGPGAVLDYKDGADERLHFLGRFS